MAVAKGKTTRKIEETKATEVLATVKKVTRTDALTDLANTQIEVQKTLSEIGTKLTDKLSIVENLDTAITLKKQELESLHGIQVEATTLDNLRAEIEQTRAAAQQEEQERADRQAAEDAEILLSRKRDNEQYNYTTAQARQKATDEHNVMVARRQTDERLRQEAFDRNIAEREAVMKSAEIELKTLREQVAGIPALVEKERKAAAGQAEGMTTARFTQQLQIAELNSANAQKLAQQTIDGLTSTKADLIAQIGTLQAELKAANARAENIASKAVEAASGRDALKAVQQAQETAAAGQGGKR